MELGPAAPINAAIARWHEDIASGRDGPAAEELRRLVWEPIEKQLPPGTKTAYLCPDDKLTSIPWAALPGRKAGTVLLEDYALAVVPNGQFLLAQLTSPPQPGDRQGELLAVGDVTYDSKPVDTAPRPEWLASRAAVRGEMELFWPPLPGSSASWKP